MRDIFHPCDSNYLAILEHMYEQKISSPCDDGSNWTEALQIGSEILIAYEILYPPNDVNTALIALKLGKLASYLEKNSLARGRKAIYYRGYLWLVTCNIKYLNLDSDI